MKIVFAIPCLGFGGAERVVSVLSNELVKEHDVTILLLAGDSEVAYTLDNRVKLVAVDGGAISTWLDFRKKCKALAPDVVIAFLTDIGVMSAFFLLGTGIPVIASERNDPSAKGEKLSLKLKILNFISSHVMKGYVFQSEGARDYYPNYVRKKSTIILNPVDSVKLPTRDQKSIDNRIVSVGRLNPQKNHRMLIEAFALSTASADHTLHIYGEGALRNELSELIKELGMENKIFLEGNQAQVHEKIKNAKLFVFTSDYEGLPNALMEAMAIGLPCISTDCSPGGARMLIKDGKNGILIPCGDAERLTLKLDELCRDQQKLYELGNNARMIRQKANIGTVVDAWEAFIKSIVNNN